MKLRMILASWAMLMGFSVLQPAKVFGQSCTLLPQGVIGWWRGESNIVDFVGVNTASLVGNVGFTNGEVAQGFKFDGNGSCVAINTSTNFFLQDFTIEAWIQRSSTSIASKNGNGGVIFGFGSGGFALGMTDAGQVFLSKVEVDFEAADYVITDLNYNHIAVTKTGSSVVYYLNGVAYPATNYDGVFEFNSSVAIGARGDNHTSGFFGNVDELAFYNRALGPDEIQTIYSAGTAGKCATPVPPNIIQAPADQTVYVGSAAFYRVVASGTPPLGYQWGLNGVDIVGATSTSLLLTNVQQAQAGICFVKVTNGGGAVTNSAALIVNPTPPCVGPPAGIVSWWRADFSTQDAIGTNNGIYIGSQAYAPGESGAGFAFDGNGDGVDVGNPVNLRLQNFTIEGWVKRGDPLVASLGSDHSGDIFAGSFGSYALGLWDDGRLFLGQVGSSAVYSTGTITDTSGFHHVAVSKSGSNVVLYIDGTGESVGPYNPTFSFGGTFSVGARGNDHGSSFLGIIDEVSVYSRSLAAVEIQSIYNNGAGAKCLSGAGPAINGQPTNQTVIAGTNANFLVLASGSPPLFFQWQFHGTNIVGATNYFLSITNVQQAIAGSYQVIVSNSFGNVTSDAATLILQSPPVINTQPKDLAVIPGQSAVFLVGVSGSPPLNFQWLHEGTNLPAENGYSLNISNVQASKAGSYVVTITNVFGAVTSAPAVLTLNVPPVITNQPLTQSVPVGVSARFSVGVESASPVTYQWNFGNTLLLGATYSSLVINNVKATDSGIYSVSVSNAFGATASTGAFLGVTNAICVPVPAGLVAWWQAEGSAEDSVSGNAGSLVGNATNRAGRIGQGFYFDGNGDAVLITNNPALQLQSFTIDAWIQRASATKATSNGVAGGIFGFGFGGYLLGLQDDGHPFLTSVGVSQVVGPVQITDTNWHHIAVTKNSTNVVFYTDGIASGSQNYGGTFTFGTSAAIGSRGDLLGTWFLGMIDEVDVFNRALSAGEMQGIYFASVVGKCPTSLGWLMQPTNQVVTAGSTATLVSRVTGSRPVYYQWSMNGAAIAGATSPNLILNSVNSFQSGSYSLVASNFTGSITSSNAQLTLKNSPLVANGGFESGSFSGWVVSEIASPLNPLGIHGPGYDSGYGFFFSSPTEGNFCATHGFDGNGPGRIRIAIDVALPPSPATLTFNYRAGWDMANYPGSTKPRVFYVVIEPFGGGIGLQTNVVLTATAGTANYDTGNQAATINLSNFEGRSVRISFDCLVPESFTGPGFFQLDNVGIAFPALPPLLISRVGSTVVLSWPASFTNFAAAVSTNLQISNGWSLVDTNLIVPGATNRTLTQPIQSGNRFYRLRSQ